MKKKSKNSEIFASITFLILTANQAAIVSTAQSAENDETPTTQQFGGPNSVSGQLADDARLTESLTGRTPLEGYFD